MKNITRRRIPGNNLPKRRCKRRMGRREIVEGSVEGVLKKRNDSTTKDNAAQ